MYIGAHVSIGKGFAHAAQSAKKMGANTMQFFTRNPRGSKAKKLDSTDIQSFQKVVKANSFGPIVAHSPYTINLASPDEDAWKFALDVMLDDMKRLKELQVQYLCVHPGNHVGTGVQAGIERISLALDMTLQRTDGNTMILLETMSGSGTEIGGTFEELNMIIANCEYKDRVGVCFDTCHVYSAGYDIKNELDYVVNQFANVIGIEKLRAFHINDSQNALGSKKDRHAAIGEGSLGSDFFKMIIRKEIFNNTPFILETPGGVEVYPKEISLLRSGR